MPRKVNNYKFNLANAKSWKNARLEIQYTLRDYFNTTDINAFFLCAYLLAKFGNQLKSIRDLEKADLDYEIKYFAVEMFSRNMLGNIDDGSEKYDLNSIELGFQRVMSIGEKYSKEDFILALISPLDSTRKYQKTSETPQAIIKLANRILEIKEGEEVADFGSGYGQYLISTAANHSGAQYTGYEINARANIIAKMRSEFIDGNFNWNLGNVFYTVKQKYDKIFCNASLETRYPISETHKILEILSCENAYSARSSTSEWLFNMLINNKLKENGKAVAIAPSRSAFGGMDRKTRKYFVEHHLIEAVIALPNRIFPSTSVYTIMFVFSHNNDQVKLIDARDFYTSGRRQNTLSKKNIDDIMNLLTKDKVDETNTYRKDVDEDAIRTNDYLLEPSSYLTVNYNFKNATPLKKVIRSITRGAQIKASDLDTLASQTPTDMQYLMISNIKNGIVDDQLTYLKQIDPSDEKYCVKDMDLVFSRSEPFKIAVVRVKEGQKILAGSNFYILEIDKDKVNPYYLAALFNSHMGETILSHSSSPSLFRVISMKSINDIVIPLPSLNVQNMIAEKYLIAVDKVKLYQKRLDNAINDLDLVISDESGELCD